MAVELERRSTDNFEDPFGNILDPLEGIINGENRHERYINFTTGVLGKIWSKDSSSGEYGDDFWRTTRWNERDISGYLQSCPTAVDPINLSSKDFDRVIQQLGPDYVRVRAIPSQLLNNKSVIVAGGSCVLETWAMRTVSELNSAIAKKSVPSETLSDFVWSVINMSPTISHISGAVLSGQEVTVHYVESDMWIDRIAQYGIPRQEAQILVEEAYERINRAVTRRAKLINPKAQVVNVNFDELDLPKAVSRWFHKMGLEENDHRVAEVIYTYDGPEQLDLLKNALIKRLETNKNILTAVEKRSIVHILNRVDTHLRIKQIDHLRWGSMDLPKEVIIGIRPMNNEEYIKYTNDYAFRMRVVMTQYIYTVNKQNNTNVMCAGFADLPASGYAVQHESRNVGIKFKGIAGTSEFTHSLRDHLASPARLHRNNIDKHLVFLQEYIVEHNSMRSALIAEMKSLQKESIKRIEEIRKELSKKPTYFPLSDNPFVHHAMQFLWDPDFIRFLQKAVFIHEERTSDKISREEANERVRVLMYKIYPKIEAYINYLYGRIDYPHAIRNSKVINNYD